MDVTLSYSDWLLLQKAEEQTRSVIFKDESGVCFSALTHETTQLDAVSHLCDKPSGDTIETPLD